MPATPLTDRALNAAKQTKHRLFVIRKHARRAAQRTGVHGTNIVYRQFSRMRPHRYVDGRYPGTFVDRPSPGPASPGQVDNTIYCFWTGRNELTPNRARNLQRIRDTNPSSDVVLVTPDNLAEFLVPGHPLHPAYDDLSLVHKSDYLRTYFMHHHGGGYTDIKESPGAWLPLIESLRRNPGKWAVGYPELSVDMCSQLPGRLGRDLKIHHRRIIGLGAFIMRPRTPFTTEWYEELHARLDSYADALAKNPGDERGTNPGYPIPWTGILGDIMQPLCLKYRDRLVLDDRIKPSFKDYK